MGVIHGVNDEAAFGAYQGVAMPTIEQYGGKMVWVSTGVEVGNGDWSPRASYCSSSKAAPKPENGTTPPSTKR